jgi:dihydrodiol dehydrogenase / D-xylose 1-dehydrogenase (NADP)
MAPTTIRWGILATGGIALTFTRDLLVDPQTRGVNNIKHTVVAAASSSSKQRASEFLKEVNAPSDAKAYGSYKELAEDPDVDIIYVSTPHSHHYQNAMLCLEAGKNVLCEKAFTVNAAQAKKLIEKAKAKNLFLMEAVWTRYFPLSIYVRELITSGKLGYVSRVFADNSINGDWDDKHRMVNPDLAGGALLDLGIYSLTWVFQTLYLTQDEKTRKPPSVVSSIKKHKRTGVDEMTTILLTFPRSQGDAHAIATTQFRAQSNPDNKDTAGAAVRVQGDKGEVQVFPPIGRPTKTKLILKDGTVEEKEWEIPGPGKGSGWKNGFGGTWNAEGEGHGMFWEADEAALAIVEGRKQGRYENWEESVTIMETMDEVRRQNDLRYPEKIETTDFPVDL